MKITSSILLFILFAVVIAAPPAILQYTGNTALITDGFWTVYFFMSGITFLILVVMLVAGSKDQQYLTAAFLGGTTLKLLACLIFIFVFLHKTPSNKAVFLGDFLYVYLLNTVFEVYILLRNLRHENLR